MLEKKQIPLVRRTRLAFLVMLLGALAGAPGGSALWADPLVSPAASPLDARLAQALAAGNHPLLARLGASAGARGLEPALRSANRAVIMAAVLAAPAAADGWALLELLAGHAAGPDRPMAVAAAVVAARIASHLEHEWDATYQAHEIPEGAIARWHRTWQAIAADPGRWSDVRVHALEVSAHLALIQPTEAGTPAASAAPPAYDLSVLAADADEEVRRAAFELLPHPPAPGAIALAARAVTGDADPAAALAAAQALCSGLGLGEPPAPVLAALGPAGMERLRRLVTDSSLAPGARIDGARCLAADRTPESRRALQRLQSSLPGRIRGQVQRLLPPRP